MVLSARDLDDVNKTTILLLPSISPVNLDCKNSFNAAQSILLKEEDQILEKLIRNLYCQNCLKSVVDGTPTRLLTKKHFKDFIAALGNDGK